MDPKTEFERVSAKYARSPWWVYVAWPVAIGSVVVWSILTDRSWAFSAGVLLSFFGTEFVSYRLRENARRFADGAGRS